jgi:IS5 family transposase
MPLLAMLRIHCMQQWFSFSDRQMEDALYEIESVRRFAGFAGVTDVLPDETTILNFRHFLEDNGLTAVLLDTINAHLKAEGLLVSKGTMVDATIVHAPRSATLTCTPANTADITELPKLLREDDEAVFGDAAYTSDEYKRGARHLGMRRCVNDKRKPNKNLSSKQKKRNRKQSSVRARVEHIFRIIKCQFGFRPPRTAEVRQRVGNPRRRKTRYRGLAKNASQVNMLVGLANLYLLRRPLVAA